MDKNGELFLDAVRLVIQEASKQSNPARAAHLTAFGVLTIIDGAGESFATDYPFRICVPDEKGEYKPISVFHYDL